jgi:UDP-N-acetylmuramoyl-L-alanyl-D-glutamate--2,6-diaminopimelate ligase
VVLGITDDSREVQPDFLFVAIPGVHVDGHRFIPQAIAAGAMAVVGERPASALALDAPARQRPIIYARVPNAREALGRLHAQWLEYPSRRLALIGVTGTDGKTTTVNVLHAILTAAGLKAGMISTVNARIGDRSLETGLHTTTPPAAQVQRYLAEMVAAGITHAVLEATSEGLAQHRLAGCDFDVAVVTNITHEHLNYHGTWEAYREAKAMLFRNVLRAPDKPGQSKIAVLNRDDERSYAYLADILRSHERAPDLLVSYSIARTQTAPVRSNDFSRCRVSRDLRVDVRAEKVTFDAGGLTFTLQSPWGSVEIVSPLLGVYNVSNILAAASAALALGVSPAAVAEGVAAVQGVPGRMERIDVQTLTKASDRVLAIVDFAHTPNALRRTLEAVRRMLQDEPGPRSGDLRPTDELGPRSQDAAAVLIGPGGNSTPRRVILVFGSAGLRDQAKRRMMGEVAGRMADLTIITAEDPRTESLDAIMSAIAEGVESQGRREGVDFWRMADRGEAIHRAVQMARPGDVVVACGKGHEQSMCFGTHEYPWDDREAMRFALRGEILDTLPTAQ